MEHKSRMALAMSLALSLLPALRVLAPAPIRGLSLFAAIFLMITVTAVAARDAQSNTPAASGWVPASQVAVSSLKLGRLTPEHQADWLQRMQDTHALEKFDDARLAAIFQSLDPHALPDYIRRSSNGYPSYEFTMLRSERIHGRWPDQPDHMLVRIAHAPLRIYARWLPDGSHAGQEVIYDESKRRGAMYAHPGGLLDFVSMWVPLDGILAHSQSRHEIRDLGLEYIADQFLVEGQKYRAAGVFRPSRVKVRIIGGARVVALTYTAPATSRHFYARKETLGLDLRHPYFRSAESYDSTGRPFERVVFERITPEAFGGSTFDPTNPAYHFR